MRAQRVPVYVGPLTVIGTTIAVTATIVAAGYLAGHLAYRTLWRVMHDHPIYGRPAARR